MLISILLCTCNRSASLRRTLESLGKVRVPGANAELVVVDNGSTDDTADAVRNAGLKNMDVRYLLEPGRGKARALNTGLDHVRGDIILFTDDDVLVAQDWVQQ